MVWGCPKIHCTVNPFPYEFIFFIYLHCLFLLKVTSKNLISLRIWFYETVMADWCAVANVERMLLVYTEEYLDAKKNSFIRKILKIFDFAEKNCQKYATKNYFRIDVLQFKVDHNWYEKLLKNRQWIKMIYLHAKLIVKLGHQ